MTHTHHVQHDRIRFGGRLALIVALAILAAACDVGTASDNLAAADEGLQVLSTQAVSANAPAGVDIVGLRRDTGVVDLNQNGVGDYGNYGMDNRALSVGEQPKDGHNLRYVAPFRIPDAARAAVRAGAKSTLSFTVWRVDALKGRNLVVTALPGPRRHTDDFNRRGTVVYRGAANAGRMTVDITKAVKEASTKRLTFRFALDVAPTKGDGAMTQINIATAESRSTRPPTMHVGARPVPTPTPTPTPAPAGMSLVWSDEFTGTALDTRVWKPYHSTYGDGNNELQCHTPDNVALSGGTMKITARRGTVTCPSGAVRDYSSGFLGTRETGTYFPRYGRFEVRAKVPHGQGLWPAFWLRHRQGSSTAEVDVMEYFHSQVPGQTTGTLHLDGRYNLSKRTVDFEAPTSSPGWHTWAVDIDGVSNGVRFTFLLDGEAFHSYVDTQRRWATAAPSEDLWDIALNLSVGGDWIGDPSGALGYLAELERCAQGGTAPLGCVTTDIRRATFAATYEVDYVRVYRKN